MKEPFSFERGRVVESTQGRDRGKTFLVLEECGKDLVMIADGMNHKLSNPKKKKTKHLRAKPDLIDWAALLTLLVSVIIGVTNIIPFFGPLIGAIPSALIILMVDPSKCLIFAWICGVGIGMMVSPFDTDSMV